jgi:hypothetical protein
MIHLVAIRVSEAQLKLTGSLLEDRPISFARNRLTVLIVGPTLVGSILPSYSIGISAARP